MHNVVLVDPYSAGSALAPVFAERGVPAVAVLTTPEPIASFLTTWHPEHFSEVFVLDDEDKLTRRLRELDPLCVLPGAESGVEAAERLSERLLPGRSNVPELSAARRDKWQMALALADAGVPHLRQLSSSDADEVAEWLRANDLSDSAIVLKPQNSAGADDVFVARAGDDWRALFDRILGSVNRLELTNTEVLVQELAEGVEYEVDTYSVDGTHGLVSVWRYAKQSLGNRLGLYLSTTVIPPGEEVIAPLFGYVRQVLDAVGLRNGPAHVEVMMTPAGPRLIEVGARLAGSDQQDVTRLAVGDSQVDRTVRHWVERKHAVSGYELLRHVRSVYLSAPGSGVLRSAERLGRLAELLPTLHNAVLPHLDGSVVARTVDLWTSLGHVVLASDDPDAIDRDEALLREIEAELRVEPS
ncbi:ATP-grasp domain-containing protein [Allokutzneria sp. A3M-2-11 16]|uniref:ATP-grasp domain-containing protein n=1 Tax=Allokutzneria sp. A3M-2-11 16 TaxID=2962043 RepID=UPI0020B8FD96|nr:ATP-grasp domain-containing protein [Allokutzneria sp. A3M-2-11 16]MCP3799812.1 ATP-grasp domain-containing protein [Allokutzneria sp. A3M-2-11 16]